MSGNYGLFVGVNVIDRCINVVEGGMYGLYDVMMGIF